MLKPAQFIYLYSVYRLRHALIDPEVIKVKDQGHALPVCVWRTVPQLLGWGIGYLYPPTIPEVSAWGRCSHVTLKSSGLNAQK